MEGSSEIKEETKPVEEGPSRSNDLSKTLPEEAFNNFLQGKRNMLVQDYSFAVQSLATACEMYAQHFGEMALECGEVHFLYGKALFRLSQQQAGVLGGALNEEVTEEEEEGKSSGEDSKENDESEKNDSDTEENGDENEAEAAAEEDEKEPSESTDSPQAVAVEDATKETEKADEQAPAEADTTIKEEDGEEASAEDDDLELAWNSLETAKSIFLRQGEDNIEAQLKVAEILQLLAEISMESDNNAAAITDLHECLKIKKRHLKPDDRLLAETYYQMGLAQMLEKMYPPALENFMTTMEILELRKENLKNTIVPEEIGSFEKADKEKEIEDLDSVLADIKEKVEDTRELIRDAKKALEDHMMKVADKEGFPAAENSEKKVSKPVSNITHLLKRKKPEQEDDKERESKRTKLTSNVQNGDAMVTE